MDKSDAEKYREWQAATLIAIKQIYGHDARTFQRMLEANSDERGHIKPWPELKPQD